MKRQIEIGDRVSYAGPDWEGPPTTGVVVTKLPPVDIGDGFLPSHQVGIVPDAYMPGKCDTGPSFSIRRDDEVRVVETLAEREGKQALEYVELWHRLAGKGEELSVEERLRYQELGRLFNIHRHGQSAIFNLAAEAGKGEAR